MQSADEPTEIARDAASNRSSQSTISVAILAALACLPLVIAAGFLTDRSKEAVAAAAIPPDISPLALRGAFDAVPDRRQDSPMRAGY